MGTYAITLEVLGRIAKRWDRPAADPRSALLDALRQDGKDFDDDQDGFIALWMLGEEIAYAAGAQLFQYGALIDDGRGLRLAPCLGEQPVDPQGRPLARAPMGHVRVAAADGATVYTAQFEGWFAAGAAPAALAAGPAPKAPRLAQVIEDVLWATAQPERRDVTPPLVRLHARGWILSAGIAWGGATFTYDPAQTAAAPRASSVSGHVRLAAAREAALAATETPAAASGDQILGRFGELPLRRGPQEPLRMQHRALGETVYSFDNAPAFIIQHKIRARPATRKEVEGAGNKWRPQDGWMAVFDGGLIEIYTTKEFAEGCLDLFQPPGADGMSAYLNCNFQPVYVWRFPAAGTYRFRLPKIAADVFLPVDAGVPIVLDGDKFQHMPIATFKRTALRWAWPGVALCSAGAGLDKVEAAAAAIRRDPLAALRGVLPPAACTAAAVATLLKEVSVHLEDARRLSRRRPAKGAPRAA